MLGLRCRLGNLISWLHYLRACVAGSHKPPESSVGTQPHTQSVRAPAESWVQQYQHCYLKINTLTAQGEPCFPDTDCHHSLIRAQYTPRTSSTGHYIHRSLYCLRLYTLKGWGWTPPRNPCSYDGRHIISTNPCGLAQSALALRLFNKHSTAGPLWRLIHNTNDLHSLTSCTTIFIPNKRLCFKNLLDV